jgi:hypothetical protein
MPLVSHRDSFRGRSDDPSFFLPVPYFKPAPWDSRLLRIRSPAAIFCPRACAICAHRQMVMLIRTITLEIPALDLGDDTRAGMRMHVARETADDPFPLRFFWLIEWRSPRVLRRQGRGCEIILCRGGKGTCAPVRRSCHLRHTSNRPATQVTQFGANRDCYALQLENKCSIRTRKACQSPRKCQQPTSTSTVRTSARIQLMSRST